MKTRPRLLRSKNAFFFFLKANYNGKPVLGCGAAWHALSQAEKDKYKVLAAEAKQVWWNEKRLRNPKLPETFPSQSTSSSSAQIRAAACPPTPTAKLEAKSEAKSESEDDSDVVILSEFYLRRKVKKQKKEPVVKHEPVSVGEVVELSDFEDDLPPIKQEKQE